MELGQTSAERVSALTGLIRGATRICFLTGAGMSTESGIPDFRSAGGLYATGTNESVFDIDLFRRDPKPFYDFSRTFSALVMAAQPNAGHQTIAALEQLPDKDVAVATQNIDLLHQMAGSSRVFPVHGTVEYSTCQKCEARVKSDSLWPEIAAGGIPRHRLCGGVFKPDVVFFGEMLPEDAFLGAQSAIRRADLLVVAGTSLAVYPAAALPSARRHGCPLVIINRTPTPLDAQAQLRFPESVSTVLGALATELQLPLPTPAAPPPL